MSQLTPIMVTKLDLGLDPDNIKTESTLWFKVVSKKWVGGGGETEEGRN